jgi:hypothetical protein
LCTTLSDRRQLVLPSFTWTDSECLADMTIRKDTRVQHPGACSLEFQSMMQIIIEAVIGWDRDSCTGTRGIFGVPIAFAGADEEQGRHTLHRHLQLRVHLMHLGSGGSFVRHTFSTFTDVGIRCPTVPAGPRQAAHR